MSKEYDKDVYDELLVDAFDVFESQSDGTTHISETDGYCARIVMSACKIEGFVDEVVSTSSAAFKRDKDRNGRIVSINYRLSGFIRSLGGIADHLPDDYEYSANVDLFMGCYSKLGLDRVPFPIKSLNESILGKPAFEMFNELISMIRAGSQEPAYKLRKKSLRDRSSKRMSSALKLVVNLFKKHNKLLVLRIDLSYRKEHKDSVTPEDAKSDLSRLLNNTRGNKTIFEYLVGYIWKLEYGRDKGYHYHVILFFNGSDVRSDFYRAMLIGEYWKNVITKGRGIYFNCNAKKRQYTYIGIGMVRRNDFAMLENLKMHVIKYLAKSEQYLRAKKLGNNRCFAVSAGPSRAIR